VKTVLNVPQLEIGQRGLVVRVRGGRGVVSRLDAMGIRPGIHVCKVSGRNTHGPQTVRACNAQLAMGYGVAARVLVELTEDLET
jgi:ferrous iron transport protein A